MAAKTRSSQHVWLIGFPTDKIIGAKLPSGRDVMRFFIKHRENKCTTRESAHTTYDELIKIWDQCRIPVKSKRDIIDKIEKLYKQQQQLSKSIQRSNLSDIRNQEEYSIKLDKLFDIAHAHSNYLIQFEEDRQFLAQQRIDRSGSIGGIDSSLATLEGLSAERRARRELSQSSAPKSQFTSQEIDSEPDETTYEDTSDDGTFTYNSTAVKKQRIISPKVNAVLDRTNTSVRKASMIAASVLNTAGVPSSTVSLSKSNIHRQRQKQRQKSAQEIRQGFSSTKSVVHWDGKLLPDTDESTQLVDRIAVLLTSSEDSSTKLLGVPKLLSGTGKEPADAVKGLLESGDIGTDTVGACFDTTASNTGQYTGACVLPENLLERPLLWLACRHHIFEVLLSDVFTTCMGPSSGPDILLFKHFRSTWPKLHHQPQDTSPLVVAPTDVLQFLRTTMDDKHPREDYLELIHLAAIMVGLPVVSSIRRPGALNRHVGWQKLSTR